MDFIVSLEIILIVSAAVVFLLHRLKIPSLVGFLVAGAVIGPYGLAVIKDVHAIELMAEIGVVLLLFTIGIEFSIGRLVRMKRAVMGGGSIQALLTIAVSAAGSYIATEQLGRSVFVGFLITLSSTAIVLKMLAERGEIDTPHGRVMVGILIFQDLCVVPYMLLTPVLAGEGANLVDISLKMGKALLIIGAVIFSARWVMPELLHQVVHTRSRELFITTIIMLCLGIALLTARFGLSLALGAFLAGLVISESEYAHQATADILPFKDSFIGIFFVSVGMLMDIRYLSGHAMTVTTIVLLIFGLKVITGALSSLVIGNPLRTSLHTGLGLAQIGEFSFVLASAGKEAGIITGEFYQLFLSSSVLTMTLTPFVLKAAPSVSAWLTSRKLLEEKRARQEERKGEGSFSGRRDHVIIIGFGLNGRNLAKVLQESAVPYVVLDMNSETIRKMRKKGEPIYYGDGTSSDILHKIGIERARLLVVAISDAASTRGIVSIARQDNPEISIIARTRYLSEVDDLRALGADEVIPEEFETSIEIFSRVLQKYNFPNSMISEMADRVRSDNYTALREMKLPQQHLFEKCQWLPEIELDGFQVGDNSWLAGKGIGELQVRKKTGATIIAVRRGAEVFANPSPEFKFRPGDIVLFTGERVTISSALAYFKGKGP